MRGQGVVLACSYLTHLTENDKFSVSQFEAAMMTTGGRVKFVDSMDAIVKGVKQVRLSQFHSLLFIYLSLRAGVY